MATTNDGIQFTIEHDGIIYRRIYRRSDARDNVIVLGRLSSTNPDERDSFFGAKDQDSIIGGIVTSRGRAAFVSPVMSRQHARLVFSGDGMVYLSDPPNHSHHGTFVTRGDDTFRVEHPQPLQTGDQVTFGKAVHRGGQSYEPLTAKVQILNDDPGLPNILSSLGLSSYNGSSFNGRGYSLPAEFGSPPRADEYDEEGEDYEVYKDDSGDNEEAEDGEEESPDSHKFYAIEEVPDHDNDHDNRGPAGSSDIDSASSPIAPTNQRDEAIQIVSPDDPRPIRSSLFGSPFNHAPGQHTVYSPRFTSPPSPLPGQASPWRMFYEQPSQPPLIAKGPRVFASTLFQPQRPAAPTNINLFQPFGPFGSSDLEVGPFYPRPTEKEKRPEPNYIEIIDVDAQDECDDGEKEIIDVDAFSTPEPEEGDEEEDDDEEEDAVGSSDMDESNDENEGVQLNKAKDAAVPTIAVPIVTKDGAELESLKAILSNVKDLTGKLDKLLVDRHRSKRRITLNKIQADTKLAALQTTITALQAKVVERNQVEADIQQHKKEMMEDMETRKRSLMSDLDVYEEDVKYEVDRALESVDELMGDVDEGTDKVDGMVKAVQQLKTEMEATIRAEVDAIRAAGIKAMAEIDEGVAGVKRKRADTVDDTPEMVIAPVDGEPSLIAASSSSDIAEPSTLAASEPVEDLALAEILALPAAGLEEVVEAPPPKRRRFDMSTLKSQAIHLLVGGAAVYFGLGQLGARGVDE